MTTLRAFTCDDLFRFNNILGPLCAKDQAVPIQSREGEQGFELRPGTAHRGSDPRWKLSGKEDVGLGTCDRALGTRACEVMVSVTEQPEKQLKPGFGSVLREIYGKQFLLGLSCVTSHATCTCPECP
ncbi:hypothetical protein H920_09576 [Fukomys damarensis]|uniref:Uncharacterized protein n=1 Tax=Fukomys damarensis TaxID=885580 RepID=A0A091DA90_FUKDA|nr:hypothetical protein H920_09576 [Fukomys damarensis]